MKTNKINKIDEDTQPELLHAADNLLAFLDQHREINNHSDRVLRALVMLTIDRIKTGRTGIEFTAENILAEADIPLRSEENAGTKLSPIWKKLIQNILPSIEMGIQEYAASTELDYYAAPVKVASAGKHPSKYFLEVKRIDTQVVRESPKPARDEIRYIRDLEAQPSWWFYPLIKHGYRLEGWRRNLFLSYLISIFLTGFILVVALLLFAVYAKNLSLGGLIQLLLAATIWGVITWLALRPLYLLLEWRITMAPSGFVALNEIHVQLEILRDQRPGNDQPATIRLIRYASKCPTCGAKILVHDGRREFPNRLVGRCRENPAEHVYSFDRMTCLGKSLR